MGDMRLDSCQNHRRAPQNPEGSGDRQESMTQYGSLTASAHYTMVEVELLSGRTHQIRRIAKLAGHPVVGDARCFKTTLPPAK